LAFEKAEMLQFLGVFSVMLASTSQKKTPKEKNDFETKKTHRLVVLVRLVREYNPTITSHGKYFLPVANIFIESIYKIWNGVGKRFFKVFAKGRKAKQHCSCL